ncbi:MAG TPA: helix-turn-helix transcriptional regulator, partial [Paracoccaceae bacterium]|nr:helix-turn-helix transcriptional regulator [Paracoccaceae bacterium]
RPAMSGDLTGGVEPHLNRNGTLGNLEGALDKLTARTSRVALNRADARLSNAHELGHLELRHPDAFSPLSKRHAGIICGADKSVKQIIPLEGIELPMQISEVFRTMLRIRTLRRQKGMTQDRLAALAELSQGNVSEFESGKTQPTLDTLARLATALGVEMYEMFESYEKVAPAVALLEAMEGLSDDQRDAVITYAEMLRSRRPA